MVGSRRVKGAGSARTEGARRATGVGADGAAVGSGALVPGQRWEREPDQKPRPGKGLAQQGQQPQTTLRPFRGWLGTLAGRSTAAQRWCSDSAYFAEVEHRFRGSGTRIPAKWNARRSAATLVGQCPPIGFATGARVLPVTSCSKSTTILPVERVGGVLCRPRRCGKRASTAVHSAASVSCAFSIPPARSIGRPRRGLAARGTGSGLAAGVQAGVGMLISSPACGSSGRGVSVAASGPAARYGVRRGAGGRRWRRPGWRRR